MLDKPAPDSWTSLGMFPPRRDPTRVMDTTVVPWPLHRKRESVINTDLLAYLLAAAVKWSGLPGMPVDQLPPIEMVSAAYISSEVCPDSKEGCSNLVAIFDTEHYVILVRDTLDMEKAFDNSFLVHELVHVLQFRSRGPDIFKDCPTSMRTEAEAYKAQNAYLKREGQFARFGEVLRFTTCAGRQDALLQREIMLEPNSPAPGQTNN